MGKKKNKQKEPVKEDEEELVAITDEINDVIGEFIDEEEISLDQYPESNSPELTPEPVEEVVEEVVIEPVEEQVEEKVIETENSVSLKKR